jgi:hypothetical protein
MPQGLSFKERQRLIQKMVKEKEEEKKQQKITKRREEEKEIRGKFIRKAQCICSRKDGRD